MTTRRVQELYLWVFWVCKKNLGMQINVPNLRKHHPLLKVSIHSSHNGLISNARWQGYIYIRKYIHNFILKCGFISLICLDNDKRDYWFFFLPQVIWSRVYLVEGLVMMTPTMMESRVVLRPHDNHWLLRSWTNVVSQ